MDASPAGDADNVTANEEKRKDGLTQANPQGKRTSPRNDAPTYKGSALAKPSEEVAASQGMAPPTVSEAGSASDKRRGSSKSPPLGDSSRGSPILNASGASGVSALTPTQMTAPGRPSGQLSLNVQAKRADDADEEDGIPRIEIKRFVDQLRAFFQEREHDFRIPKFYGTSVNLLKLWKIVCYHGGYDKVTSGKLWRAVGDHFNPPRSCTTLSWSFRGFYEKSLLDYERVRGVPERQELGILPASLKQKVEAKGRAPGSQDAGNGYLCGLPPPSSKASPDNVKNHDPGSNYEHQEEGLGGRELGKTSGSSAAKKRPLAVRGQAVSHAGLDDAAHADQRVARAHDGAQKKVKRAAPEVPSRILQDQKVFGEARPTGTGAPLGPSLSGDQGTAGKAKGMKLDKKKGEVPGGHQQLQDASHQAVVVWDVGEECSWVKINVRRSVDAFEIFALVPGLLREEIKIQVDGPGRVVVAGLPENEDNPWGIKRFKKIVILPGVTVPGEATAVVSMHGQLYIHLPLAPARSLKISAEGQ